MCPTLFSVKPRPCYHFLCCLVGWAGAWVGWCSLVVLLVFVAHGGGGVFPVGGWVGGSVGRFVSGIVGFHLARGRRRLSDAGCGSRAVLSKFSVGMWCGIKRTKM